jgi:hypothetical protein
LKTQKQNTRVNQNPKTSFIIEADKKQKTNSHHFLLYKKPKKERWNLI